MSKTTRKTNYRVVIEPRSPGNLGWASVPSNWIVPDDKRAERDRQTCESIAADVKRHVDDVGWVGVLCDTEFVCEHCGAEWTEGDAATNGGCCARDATDEAAMDGAA